MPSVGTSWGTPCKSRARPLGPTPASSGLTCGQQVSSSLCTRALAFVSSSISPASVTHPTFLTGVLAFAVHGRIWVLGGASADGSLLNDSHALELPPPRSHAPNTHAALTSPCVHQAQGALHSSTIAAPQMFTRRRLRPPPRLHLPGRVASAAEPMVVRVRPLPALSKPTLVDTSMPEQSSNAMPNQDVKPSGTDSVAASSAELTDPVPLPAVAEASASPNASAPSSPWRDSYVPYEPPGSTQMPLQPPTLKPPKVSAL